MRVPAIFVSPSVPSNSVLRRDGLHCPGGRIFKSSNEPGKVLSHASLSATFHEWFGTSWLNERDAGAASFSCIWQPAACREAHAPPTLQPLPFRVTVPTKPNGEPVDWAPYPETGVYLYAECLVADMYLGNVRPTVNTAAEAELNENYVAVFLFRVKDSVDQLLAKSGGSNGALRPYLVVAQACLEFLVSVVQKPIVGKAFVPESGLQSFLGKVQAAVPISSRDLAKLVPPRVLMVRKKK